MPDELTLDCIELCILESQCQLRGYVLDGYPVTRRQVKLMTERALIPVKVLELKCDVKEVMRRCVHDRMARVDAAMAAATTAVLANRAKKDHEAEEEDDEEEAGRKKSKARLDAAQNLERSILNDSPEAIGYKFREWKAEVAFIRDWYENEHKCLIQLDAQLSKWYINVFF